MKSITFAWLGLGFLLVMVQLLPFFTSAQNAVLRDDEMAKTNLTTAQEIASNTPLGTVYMFGRDECGFCKK